MSKKENKRHHKSILSQFWWEVWLNVWRRSRKAHFSMFLKGWGKLRNRGVCLPRSCTGTVIFSVLLRFITFNWQLWLPTDESKLLHNQISCKTKKVIKYHIVQIFVPIWESPAVSFLLFPVKKVNNYMLIHTIPYVLAVLNRRWDPPSQKNRQEALMRNKSWSELNHNVDN